jgi:hypothetical protein
MPADAPRDSVESAADDEGHAVVPASVSPTADGAWRTPPPPASCRACCWSRVERPAPRSATRPPPPQYQQFLAAPPQPRPPRAAARLPAGGARDGAAATPAFSVQAAQQATRKQKAVHRRGLAARRRFSASARRRSACLRFSVRHSACSASASVAAPRCSSRRPVRPSQPPASLRRRSRLAHVHRLQAHVVKTAAPPPPSPPQRLTRRRQHPPLPAHVAPSAPRTRRAALSAPALLLPPRFPPLPPPRLQLRAHKQPPQHPVADSFVAQLHRLWTLSRTRHPFTRSAHPAHHRLAPPARQRSLPRSLPLCTRRLSSSQALTPPAARPSAAIQRCTTSPLPQPRSVLRR